MILDTLAACESYIYRHETHLGFKPLCIGTDKLSWEKLCNEMKSCCNVLQDEITGKPLLQICGIPIVNCEDLK